MTPAEGRTHYFGYGSNMANPVLRAVPGVTSLGAAAVDGYRLRFGRDSVRWRAGAADVVPAPGRTVWGELLEVGAEGLEFLDAKEGVALRWYARGVVPVRQTRRDALTYNVVQPAPVELVPRRDYLQHMVTAAGELGFPAAYQDFLAGLLAEVAAGAVPGRFRSEDPQPAAPAPAPAPAPHDRTGVQDEQY